MNENTPVTPVNPPVIKRISWAAVFAGLVVALVIQLMLTILGIGIGASTIDPVRQSDPTRGIGIGAGIWLVVTSILALFAGGWVAGRLAGIPRRLDSALHGILTWGLATLFAFYLLTTTLGGILSGTAGVLGQAISAAGQGAAAIAPQVSGPIQSELQRRGITLDSVRQQALSLLQQNPGTTGSTGTPGEPGAQPGSQPQPDIRDIINRAFSQGQTTLNPSDRQALVNILVERNHMTPEDANRTIDNWEQMAQQAQRTTEQTKQKAKEVGRTVSKGVTQAAIWSFVAMVIGVGSAGLGGVAATPRESIPSVR